ncbi:MAG TPA: hypothetical protein VLT86_15605 [Vicinamibacterales bacterium]|nr:hypothetical protein [Vicinamibacterales bacterium]
MTDAATTWGVLAAVAFAASLAGVWLVERHARRLGLLDLPNERSSHVEPRPRGGGLGIVLGVLAAAAASSVTSVAPSHDVWVVVSAALLVAAVGLWDDVHGLTVTPRLVAQLVAAVWVVASVGSPERLPLPPPLDVPLGLLGPLLTIVWLVAVTNFFNFMDGVDGLAAGQAILTLSALGWAMWPGGGAGVALVAAAACGAFLVRNWAPARIFLGDVGSAFVGFLLAALPLTGPPALRSRLVLLAGVSLALFLLDPVATLVARTRRGAALGAAHREHAYQQFVEPGESHARLVSWLLASAAVLSALALAAYRRPELAWPSIALAIAVFAVEWRAARRRPRHPGARSG